MGPSLNKLTLDIEGRPMVAWPVEAMRKAGIRHALVVTGFQSAAVEAALVGEECVFAHHADWAAGMGSSLAFGARQIIARAEEDEVGWDAVLICLGDLPGLRAAAIERILEAAEAGRMPDQIVVPTFEGRRGHPVLFGRAFWPDLAALSGDEGAKGVIEAAGDRVTFVEMADDAILLDLDTPENMAAWRTRAQSEA
jgi:molybdenum cofactor cytidylyltransferase